MIIGVRAHDYGKKPVGALLRAIAEDSWQTIQLAFPKAVENVSSFSDVSEGLVAETKAALERTGLSVAVLGVYVEPALADEAARKKQAKILIDALPQCKALGALCIGTETTAMIKQRGITRKEALCSLRRTLEAVLPEAERMGVNFAVEPVHYHALNTPELTRELLRDMGSSRLKVIFDPVNLLRREDIAKQEKLWGRSVELFGESVVAIHIKGASEEASAEEVLFDNVALRDSVLDYNALFQHIEHIIKNGAPVLRERAAPADAAGDIAFLKRIFAE